MEIGPYRLKDDAHLVYNEGAWDEFANVLFVDNPVGTGFSYVDTDSYVHELSDMADQMIIFLEKFFGLFPEYAKNDVSRNIPPTSDKAHACDSSTSVASRMLASISLT